MSSVQNQTNSNTVMTLADLANLAGGESITIGKKRTDSTEEKKAFENPFTPDMAYPVEVVAMEAATTKNGYDQIKVKLGIVRNDGTVQGGANVWVTLPIFNEALAASADAEKLAYLKERFGKNLHGLLKAAQPEVYNVYAKAEKEGKKYRFFDFDGEEMTKAEVQTREKLIGKAVIGAASALRDGKLSLVGQRFWYVRATNTTKANEYWDNFYGEQPTSKPLADI